MGENHLAGRGLSRRIFDYLIKGPSLCHTSVIQAAGLPEMLAVRIAEGR